MMAKQKDPNRDLTTEGVPYSAGGYRELKSPAPGVSLSLYTKTLDLFGGTYNTPYRLRVVIETEASEEIRGELLDWFRHNDLLKKNFRKTNWGAIYLDAYMNDELFIGFRMRWL